MATKKRATRRRSPGKRRRLSLAAFFRALWRKPDLLERFSAGGEARKAVLQQFDLSPAHRQVLTDGCVRDVIQELVGVPRTAELNQTVISTAEEVGCGHPECRAFMSALKPR